MVVLLFVRSELRRASALSGLFCVNVHGGPSLHRAGGEPPAIATIRTADNPRVLGNDLLASRQLRTRASQLAYLPFAQDKLALTHWFVKWVERLRPRLDKRPIAKPTVIPHR